MIAEAQAPTNLSSDTVCAVVVTYNRKDLLRECLQALLAQTQAVTKILIINNVSTDDTLEMLAAEFPSTRSRQIEVVTLPLNIGGAGGFHEGMKQAAAERFSWLWLMDDDTIPNPDALEQVFASRARFPQSHLPDLLASKVVWTDGKLHPMNNQWVKTGEAAVAFLAASAGTFPLRTTTFVSLVLHRRHVERYGLPISSYFLGGDDVEYTARILKRELGVAVPLSVVTHKTVTKAGTTDAPPQKFYFFVRNTIWMLTRSNAFAPLEGVKLAARSLGFLVTYLRKTNFAASSFSAIARGFWSGFFTIPNA